MGRLLKTLANPAEVAEQQARCYDLRLAGHSIDKIAAMTGLGHGTVHRRIKDRIDARVQPKADELRAIEVDRYDRYLERLDEQMKLGIAVARNVEVAVRVSEARAKLLGLNAPQQIEATVVQVTQEDLALAELVNEANAAAALAEQRLRQAADADAAP